MKAFLVIFVWALLACMSQALEYRPNDPLPDSDDPEEFHREVREYILYSAEYGLNVDRNSSVARKKIAEDSRNWETPLAEIISDSQQYSWGPTEGALITATIRRNGDDPRIRDAAIRRLEQTIRISIEKFDIRADDPKVISGYNSWMRLLIRLNLDLESPDVLQSVLKFLHSPEVDRFDVIGEYTPQYIAPALQKYGDLRNAEEALKVAAKLESVGRSDVATDIRRAAERIKKDAASPGGSNESSKNAPGYGDDGRGDSGKKPLWPWLAAGGALLVAVIAFFRMKRAGI